MRLWDDRRAHQCTSELPRERHWTGELRRDPAELYWRGQRRRFGRACGLNGDVVYRRSTAGIWARGDLDGDGRASLSIERYGARTDVACS